MIAFRVIAISCQRFACINAGKRTRNLGQLFWGSAEIGTNRKEISSAHAFKKQSFHSTPSFIYFQSNNETSKGQSNEIHLIDENGKSQGIMSLKQAKEEAKSKDYQLHLVKAPHHNNPHAVYKLLSKKDMYSLQKKSREKERNVHKNQSKPKELSLSTDIAGQDLNWKLKKIEEFLKENHRIKVIINRKYKSKTNLKDFMQQILDKIENGEIYGSLVETERRIRFVLKPVKS